MISIIIPTLHVSQYDIELVIENIIRQDEPCEIIISEGTMGALSSFFDNILSRFKSKLQSSKVESLRLFENDEKERILSRGESMNKGAELARGNILLFLHSDNFLPENGFKNIKACMQDKLFIGGGFLKRYKTPFAFSLTEKLLNLRTCLLKEMVGTNALFVRSSIFRENKYPLHFMEDLVFNKGLIKAFTRKRLAVIKDYLIVSPRKYHTAGEAKLITINAVIMFLFNLGIRDYDGFKEIYTLKENSFYPNLVKCSYKLIKQCFFTKSKIY